MALKERKYLLAGFIVNVTVSIRHEEPEEDMPVTLAGYSLWFGLKTSVMMCCFGVFQLMDLSFSVVPDVSSLYADCG